MFLACGTERLDLSHPRVMGILNVTPDSFADGGRHVLPQAAVAAGLRLVDEGAAIIDVGGESTRPGAEPVSEAEELRRVLPVLEGLRGEAPGTILSIDTRKPAVMRAAMRAGATLVNDVSALREPGALAALAASGAGVCLMHMQGEPRGMQRAPQYGDVVAEVRAFLEARIEACRAAGIDPERIAVDPGFGFGKTFEHNLRLLAGLGRLRQLGRPLLVGLSRKSLLGTLTGRPVAERLAGSVAISAIAVLRGASIVRAHDVAATLDAIRVAAAVREQTAGEGAA
jgi:dihydropteroate synthase